ncbi:nickel pincer cofactor biosynthesis protein LarC [Candidatus Aerophobetes bacterium]|nr:nickel pincer cofactor biosynthesis protein LarC [Candidatus Aerophobetes bacterium]
MKIAYFDCFSGISGDMVLGSLVDAGLPLHVLNDIFEGLDCSGCKITAESVKRSGISATKVNVILPSESHRRPSEILTLIDRLNLDQELKQKSKDIFLSLAKAEAKIHKEDIENLHLHELGSLDTLIDIVGSVVGLSKMGIEKVYASKVNVGRGRVKIAHGVFPVPTPATVELLKGVPVYSTDIEAELTTPTGAALLKGLSTSYGSLPDMKLEKIGYGAGERDLSSPNVLRLLIGVTESSFEEDSVTVLETNIDDMNPQFYEHIMASLFRKGALDVFLVPAYMKKNRPGVVLTVICDKEREEEMLSIIFSETTTLGVRLSHTRRKKIKRQIKSLKTSLGEVKVKVGIWEGKVVNLVPEYDDCKRISLNKGIPLRKVYEQVREELSHLPSSSIFNF